MMHKLDKPIFLIGAARSGTTMLGKIISKHPDIAYWVEPNYVWRYRAGSRAHDVRHKQEATRRVHNYITSKFYQYTKRQGKQRFMKKTPSNCFRIPFMYEIFPDGKFLHLIRDGRDVAFSAQKKWTSPPDPTAFWRRITSFEVPLVDMAYYLSRFMKDTLGRMLMPNVGFLWGPRFVGIEEARRKNYPILETCAIQWRESVERAIADGRQLPPTQYFKSSSRILSESSTKPYKNS